MNTTEASGIHILNDNTGNEHFARCQKLVIKHKLYKQALTLYKPNSPEYKVSSRYIVLLIDIVLIYISYKCR